MVSKNDSSGWFEDFNGVVLLDDECEGDYYCGQIRGTEGTDFGWRIINWVQRFKGAEGLFTHFHPANVRVANGVLELTTGGSDNRSAQVELTRPAVYGYYEASIAFSEIPFEPEKEGVEGATNAFFLYSHAAYSDKEPFEIDIEYNVNNKNNAINRAEPGLFFTVHSFEKRTDGEMKEKTASFRPDLNNLTWYPDGFNKIGVCWVPDHSVFYVNGRFAGAVCRENQGEVPCERTADIPAGEMVLILNHWSNNDRFNGLAPSAEAIMRVDSVSYTPAADISQCPQISHHPGLTVTLENTASPSRDPIPDSENQPLEPPSTDEEPGGLPSLPVCSGSLLLLAAALARRLPGA